jgi:glycosyltransferase involved in cell wall biosynthesis
MTILVSVVVPTYQRPELLRRCLAALLAQDYDPCAYEIIVADDAACDATRQLVERYCLIHEEHEECLHMRLSRLHGLRELRGSEQVTSPVQVAIERHTHVRYISVTSAHGPAAARNAGWRARH